MRATPSNPFARKPIATLLAEMHGGERLQRVLGPLALTSLGIGATIGTGIYVLTGVVARDYAGPSLMLSFLLAGVGCGFAAVCYSELASMVPVAGSAYTYAYATLGELIAWIIGWDLILEYAIGSAAVANGWSDYFVALAQNVIGLQLDPRLLSPPWDYDHEHGKFLLKTVTLASGATASPWFNLPAVAITAALTVVLVIGIRESAGFNAAMVILNIGIILTIVGVGAAYVDPRHWHPFLHKEKGWSGVAEGAARIFFAYIGFDSISTHAEEARNPQRDLAIGILSALTVCTILYVAVAAVLTGMLPYTEIDVSAPLASAFRERGLTKASTLITLGILTGLTSSLLIGNLSQARILMAMARDGMLPEGFFAAVHPRFKTPWKSTILVGAVVALGGAVAPLGFLAELVSIGTLFAFVVVSAAVLILRLTNPEIERPFRAPAIFFVAPASIVVNTALMGKLGPDNWLRLFAWLVVGLVIYFTYSRYHAKLKSAGAGVPAEETAAAFSAEVRVALGRLGMGESELQGFAAGKAVSFLLSGAAEGTVTVAQRTVEGRLRIGIYTINNVGGGLSDFMVFEAKAQAAARALGAKELELLGIELTNQMLEAVLERGGFAPTTIPVPEELGGGTFNAISRIEPVNQTEEQNT